MNKLHQTLHLQQHRHTGKLLHHRHTSYRGLAVVLGIASLAVVGLNIAARVTADSLYVYARNPAPIPTTAAVITDPADGSTLTTSILGVSGSCPVITPRVIITIIDNGHDSGSAACDSDNNFYVPITLAPGDHTLVARSTTITSDNGPDSDPIHVTYVAPPAHADSSSDTQPPADDTSTAPQDSSSGDSAISATSSLVINPDQPFIVYGPSKDAIWTGVISGGTSPYYVRIHWGDGSSNTYRVDGGEQTFRHHYSSLQSYDVTFQATDSTGAVVAQHIAVVTPYVAPTIGGSSTGTGKPLGGSGLVSLYGAYLLLLAVFGFLWSRAHAFTFVKHPVDRRAANRRYYLAAKKRRRKDDERRK